ncbi:MAG: 16S rRNA (cytosine(1402)-N(4))-methyltransferase RsmH [Gammaproteobacteria bacterium]|nr:16S rRNA (cytosine(1402)-N(4))-methyltransferase RsmH [Gammaproteobacteria bacterium]
MNAAATVAGPAHIPVMKDAAVAALNLAPGDCVVDATCGGGGHARAILGRLRALGPGGRLLAIDRDAEAVACARLALGDGGDGSGDGGDGNGGDGDGGARVEIIHAPFSRLGEILESRGLRGRVAGMLFDFGVSSAQLDTPARGFSFTAAGPLDMRMDATAGATAAEWLARVDERELAAALRAFGEERFARAIAGAIKRALARGPIADTVELARLVAAAAPRPRPRKPRRAGAGKPQPAARKHPATRTFQAIRIAVNDELGEVRRALPQAVAGLAAGGRLVVISFHSLEDRIVKRFLREAARGDPYPPDAPVTVSQLRPSVKLIGKARRPAAAEVEANRRARSAVMRVAEKLAVAAPAAVAGAGAVPGAAPAGAM